MNEMKKENLNVDLEAVVRTWCEEKHYESKVTHITMRQIIDEVYDVKLADCQRNFVSEKTMDSHIISQLLLNGVGQVTINTLADGTLLVVDGQQRITSLRNFIEDKAKVNLKGYEFIFDFRKKIDKLVFDTLNGLKFSELPAGLQNKFLDREISVEQFNGMNERQTANLYVVKNTGVVGLNKTECSKARANSNVWKRVEALVADDSFKNMVISGRNVRMQKTKSVFELLLIQQNKTSDDAFSKSINMFIDEMNEMDDDELDIIFNSFMAEKSLYDSTILCPVSKNYKSWSSKPRNAYHFFDERTLFYLFHRYGFNKEDGSVKEDIVKIIKDNAIDLFQNEATTAEMEDMKNRYNNCTTNGSDKVSGMKKAAALIYNVEEGK